MAAENNGPQADAAQQRHSLPRRAIDRLRFLLGIQDLAADPGETYRAADLDDQPQSGAISHDEGLADSIAVAPPAAGGTTPGSSAPLSSQPLADLNDTSFDVGSAGGPGPGPGPDPGGGAVAAVGSMAAASSSPAMVSPGSGTAAGAGGSAPAPGPSANKAAPLVASLLSSGGTEEDAQLTASGQIQLQGGWHAQVVPGVFQGIYGLLSVDASGHWSYQLDNGSPAVQRLNNGEVVQEHFHCLAADGTGQRIDVPIVINVSGRDDAAVISGVRSGAITEDVGLQRIGGQLQVSDIDHGDQPTFVPQSVKGQYGSLDLQSDGHWSYTADPQKIQGLAQGQQVADSFPVWTTNAQGESVRATVSVAVVGTDDGATFPPLSLLAVEDGGTVSGRLLATDVDARSLTYGPMPGSAPFPGVTIDADGMVHVDPSRPEFQSLAAGEFRTLQIPVQVVDERGTCTSALLQVQVAGSNDLPTVIVRPPLPVNEGGGTETVQVLARDVDASDRLVYGLPPGVNAPAGVSLNPTTGQVSIDTNHPAYNHLAAGEVQMVVVPVLVSDGHGGSTLTQVSFELHGSNDAPALAAIGQRTATEGGAPLTGQLSATDPDSSDQLIHGLAGGAAAPAGFTLQPDGHWAFDPRDPAYDHLRAGEQQQILVPVQVSDGHGGVSQQTLTITVTGTNDGAVIGGAHTGHVQEDVHSSVSGVLTISDADQGENHFQPQTISGHFGSLTIDLDGHWTYQLDNSNPAIQALPAGNSLIESLMVKSADGTNQRISISIHGSDDAAVIQGAHSGTVKEDGASTASGQLQVSDVDKGDNPAFHAETLQGLYGQLVIDASGHWTYQLDNASAQVLQGGTKARETFTVLASDSQGHQVSQSILVDVQGTADAAVISGTATGRVSEDQVLQASGKLDVVDPDRNEAHFNSGDQSGTYGSLHLEADGRWSYQLNNASPLVQQLSGSDQVSDRFTVTSADGTTHQITVQVAGRNDAAQISGTSSGQVTEDGQQRATGQLSVSDVDRGEAHVQAGDQVGTYGSLHLGADGAWTYTLNNSDPKVQALGGGTSATDTFTVPSADGTSQQLSVRVAGSNDAAVISGTSTGQLREDGTLSASGQLQFRDVDQGEAAIKPSDVGDKVGTYGTLHMHADGSWTYALNNSARVVQDLQAGDVRQDSFMVHSIDGTSHQLQMSVQGSSDAPVLSAGQISGAKEDTSFTVSQAQILAALQARDPDGDPLSVSSLGYGGSDATLVDNHNGTWTLTPHANWSGDLHLQVGVSDGRDMSTGTLTVPVAAVADTATMTVAPSLSSTFEDPTLGSQAYHFADPRQWGWHTDNLSGLVEQGKGETYGDPNHANTGLIELEGQAGEKDNLYRVLDTQPGAAYHFSLDVSGRLGASSESAAVEVLWEGKVIDTIKPAANAFGFHNYAYDLTAHSEHPRIEFRAVTHDGGGPIVDNPRFEFRGFNGTEDTELPIKLSVETVDKDGSETITTGIKGLPTGFAITDGTTGHRLTSTGPTQTLDMQGWDLQHLKVVPAANFNGRVDAVLIATTTESSNHDQSVTQIPVPLNFAAVNDPPTVRIGTSNALAEDSTEKRTEQITASDSDGDATSIDTSWLTANHWSTSDSGRTYTKAGTYGTATLTVATNQVSYQLNNSPGGPTDKLAAGQNGRDAFELQITDGHGGSTSGTAIFNVNGTNDAPTVTAGVASATLIEGRSDTATSVLTILDKDSTDPSPTVDRAWLSNHGWITADGGQTYTKVGTYGDATLMVMANTVSYHLNNTPGGATDLLRAGAAAQDQFQVQVVDIHGATATTQVGFNLSGTNDAPVLTAQSKTATEDSSALSGQMVATDFDQGDSHAFSIANPVPGLTFHADGSYSFNPSDADYQSLKAGETRTVSIPVTVTDSAGATSHQNLTITVTGTNDSPVLSAQSKAATEDGSVVTGQMVATDSDRGDTQTFSIANPVAGLSFHADGSYTFDPSDAAYQSLKAGETRTLTIPVTVTDSTGASTQQNLSITVTGTNEAPTVTADTTAHSATLTSAREDTAQTYSSAYLLGQVGAADSDSDVAHLSVTDVHVDPTYGSFRSSVSPSGTTDWIFTPAANYASTPGTPIPITLTIKDQQGGVTTAYAQTSVSSVTDTATPALTVSVEHEVMLFGSQAKPAATNNSHVYAEVGGGQITQATFEVISVGDRAHPGDPTSGTGPVILNLATDNTNNLVSFWRPANLSVAFNGTDYSTDRNLAAGVTGGINMTSGTHRVTTTWDSTTGTLNIYDNGKLHNTFTNVLQGSHLDVTTAGLLTLGQKMNDPKHLGGFRENEQYNGTIFSASFGTKALSVHDIESGPMANLPATTTGLQANFQARNGAVTNEISGPLGSTSSFHTGTIGFKKEYIDVSAMPPPVGATLTLTLNVAAPSDTDDTISRQWLRGLPVGTVLSDGNGHQLTVGSNTLVNLTADTHNWVLTNGLTAQLPAGYNTNLPLQLVAESTGPDGSIARSTGDALIVFNPDGTKTPLGAPTDADLGVAPAPAPPPPAPGAGEATAVASASMDHLEMADGISRPTELTDHHTAADSTHADGVQGLPSSQDLVALPAPSTGAGLGSADSAEAKTLSDPALDPDALQSAAHFLATSTNPQVDQAGVTRSSADHADPSIGLAIDPTTEAPDLSADLLAQVAHQLTTAPSGGVADIANGNGHGVDVDQVPLLTSSDPFMFNADGNSGGTPEAEVTLPPPPEARPDENTDQLSHLG